jgi:ComF family protein
MLMKKTFLAFGRAVLNLIYPIYCVACGGKIERNTGLCAGCIEHIHVNTSGPAACRYEGAIKKAIHSLKYRGFKPVANILSEFLLGFIHRNINMAEIDMIVPVPLHPVSLRQRGFNQAQLLSLAVSKKYGLPMRRSCLSKTRHTPPQSGLNRQKRLTNLNGAFKVRYPETVKDKNILLIDDVYTTGATAGKASGALKRAGAARVEVAALAGGL